MYISRAVLLLVICSYLFAPSIFGWMIDPRGSWYRPYLLWAVAIALLMLTQIRQREDDVE